MQTFKKAERLCSRVLIGQLVEKGKSFSHSPFRVTWMRVEKSEAPVQVMFSAPKRNFKKAVDRNRIKRLMREAYRKNKPALYDELGGQPLRLIFVYTPKQIISYGEMSEKMAEVMKRLGTIVAKKNEDIAGPL